MRHYRVEIRIFGLLILALISSVILGYGIRAAEATGEILGVKVYVAGPSTAFIVLILIFWITGLFKLGLEPDDYDYINRPVETMSLEDIDGFLDSLEIRHRQLERRQRQLEQAKEALQSGATSQGVLAASGMRAARRNK